jgi:hypothetical protein
LWRERFGISYITVFPEYMEPFAPTTAPPEMERII